MCIMTQSRTRKIDVLGLALLAIPTAAAAAMLFVVFSNMNW